MNTNNLIDKIAKTSIAVIGTGLTLTAIGAMDLRMQYEPGYINPLVKTGWATMSVGVIPFYLAACKIMSKETYKDIKRNK